MLLFAHFSVPLVVFEVADEFGAIGINLGRPSVTFALLPESLVPLERVLQGHDAPAGKKVIFKAANVLGAVSPYKGTYNMSPLIGKGH